ncbi:hypothetical protein [Streptomyces prunicolor]
MAAAFFAVAFIIRVTETSTDVIFSPTSLMLLGLALLAAHSAGVGSGWSTRRNSSRGGSTRSNSSRRSASRR